MRILMLDIETAPTISAVWGLWNQNIGITQILEPGYTLCWSAKWYGEKGVMFGSIRGGKDKMLRTIHRLMEEADAVCHYNGLKFDLPTINKEFVLAGMSPPSPAKQIDLLRVVKGRFRLVSNKLDFVAQALGLGKKIKTKGMELWFGCMHGDNTAWRSMERYNKQDVVLLEKLYTRLRPWIKHHPIHTLTGDRPLCPTCGSKEVNARGIARTKVAEYRRFQCKPCGSWFRDNVNLVPRNSKKYVGAA